MSNAYYVVPEAYNEPVLNYAPGSAERAELQSAIKAAKSELADIPMFIGGKEIRTNDRREMRPPHELSHLLGHYNYGTAQHVNDAITASLNAKADWENTSWEHRAAILLKAADLLAGPYRARMNAATMLAQSKNAFQAEIDAAAEMIDFFRFNAQYMTEIYSAQPVSADGIWNRTEYRPLEGFIFAVTPFNFTSIAANLCTAPALVGNTVVWKPSDTQIYSAWVIMDLLREAGLPDGVINLVYADGPEAGNVAFNHADFSGIHFTGSTATFQYMWKTIGNNISNYKTYPRIVGETGGKDFIVAHPSADAKAVAVSMSRGAFEFQGQKCSAASRAYIPSNIWEEVKGYVLDDLATFKMGKVDDFSNFINAVIDERSYDKITGYLSRAEQDSDATIIAGGKYSKEEGYFIEPTIIQAGKPDYITMCDELFGPVLSVYVYDESKFDETLEIVDRTSPYGLTGALFSQDRYVIESASKKLRHAAGNFYINDKPTGAVVGQQPFGGSRASGTNDKAGSAQNLQRWISPRSIKETFVPAKDYRYPFLKED